LKTIIFICLLDAKKEQFGNNYQQKIILIQKLIMAHYFKLSR